MLGDEEGPVWGGSAWGEEVVPVEMRQCLVGWAVSMKMRQYLGVGQCLGGWRSAWLGGQCLKRQGSAWGGTMLGGGEVPGWVGSAWGEEVVPGSVRVPGK